MAQKVLVSFVDDIDGTEAEGTVKFGLDGTDYEIDLNAKNTEALRKALARYVEVARRTTLGKAARVRVRGDGRRVSAQLPGVPSEEIRAWAKQRGYKVNDRGRIPASIVAEYNALKNGGEMSTAVQSSTAPAALQQLPPKEDIAATAEEPPAAEEPATVKSGPARGGRKPAARKPKDATTSAAEPAAAKPAARSRRSSSRPVSA